MVTGGIVALLYYVYLHYLQYIMAVAVGFGALCVLVLLYNLFRKYGSLLLGGVPYAMGSENIVAYAWKYFPEKETRGVVGMLEGLAQDKDGERYLRNLELHLELIRDALFNPANPAYAEVDLTQLPPTVVQALMPDFLGLYGKGWRFKLDTLQSYSATSKIGRSNRGRIRFCYKAIGMLPVLDNWHRKRIEIAAIMGMDCRYSLGEGGVSVWVFDMFASDWPSPYDDEFERLGFDLEGYGKYASLRHPDLKALAERQALLAEPPQEEFIAPEPMLIFREAPADEGGHLWREYIFLGTNIRDGKPYWKKLSDFQHHLICGISGYGKSVFLNQVLQGVRYNADRFEHVYLVDLKGGVELAEYEDYGEQFKVFFRYEELHAVVQGLVDLMYARLDDMRENRVKKWTGKRTLFMVDEFAQIALQMPENKEEKAAHVRLLANLNKLSMLGRGAGVLLWIQLQKATTDVMDSSFRNNLQAQVGFRVSSRLAAALLFGEAKDLEIDPTRLRRGQCIYYDDATGETVYLQSHMRLE